MLVGTGEEEERQQKDMDGGKEGRTEDHGVEEDNLFITFILRLMKNDPWT